MAQMDFSCLAANFENLHSVLGMADISDKYIRNSLDAQSVLKN